MESKDLTKKYYRIGEVAELTGLPLSTLRYWETQLGVIKPKRNNKGTRYYSASDVETIRVVNYLVKEKGMKLEAARQQLRANREVTDRRALVVERLRALRERVQLLLDAVNSRSSNV